MQSNPVRVYNGLNKYNRRLKRYKLETGKWITTIGCYCCSFNEANHRQWQKRLSKRITLRSHRS